MPRITLAAVPPETAENKSFRTHANYLRAFATLAGFHNFARSDAVLPALATRAWQEASQCVPPAAADETTALDCLRRAWGTELLLVVTQEYSQEEDEVSRLANSWNAVQCYYAAYGAAQALAVATGDARPTSHGLTQERFADLWRGDGTGGPWSFMWGDAGYEGGPGRPIETSLHAWANCDADTAWDIAAQALRSTRRKAITEAEGVARRQKLQQRKEAWQAAEAHRTSQGKRPRRAPTWPSSTPLTAAEKASVASVTPPATVLDYLFRLRIKANYEDAKMFTEGPSQAHESWAVARDFRNITAANMLVHELRVRALLGGTRVVDAAEQWAQRNYPGSLTRGLPERLTLLSIS